jgi:hypothetical protein
LLGAFFFAMLTQPLKARRLWNEQGTKAGIRSKRGGLS